jgi:AraC-like DNA-binding protein
VSRFEIDVIAGRPKSFAKRPKQPLRSPAMSRPAAVPRPARTPSTFGNWVHAIIRALDARGLRGMELALAVGVSQRALDDIRERVPQPTVTALWQRAVEVTADPCFGLHVPRHVTMSTFGALAYALSASRDLRSGLERIVRYQKVISDAVEVRLEAGEDRYGFAIDLPSADGPPFEAIDAFLAVTARVARGLMGGRHRVEPLRVCLRRPEPSPSDLFARVFRAPVVFAAPRNVIEYAKPDLELPLPDANLELARQNDEIVARQLATLDSRTHAERVHAALLDTMPDGPTESAVARALGMSTSSLQSLLAREGTTYKEVLNRVRANLARGYLAENRYAIKEVAFLLGFSDAATFSRAFKRWTGTSPKRYAGAGESPASR